MRLQKSPLGLLELFRLRDQGRNPPDFAEAVAPTVDVSEYYGADLLGVVSDTTAADAFPRTLTRVIDQPIRVHAIGIVITIGAAAGTWCTWHVGFIRPDPTSGNNPTLCPVGGDVFTPRIGATFVFGVKVEPFVLPAGSSLQASATGDAAGADHVVALRYLHNTLNVTQ